LEKYRNSLLKLQTVEKTLLAGSLTKETRKELEREHPICQKELKEAWIQHTANVSRMTKNNYWRITPSDIQFAHPNFRDPVRISYGFLKTKLDMDDDKGYKVWKNYSSLKGRLDEGISP